MPSARPGGLAEQQAATSRCLAWPRTAVPGPEPPSSNNISALDKARRAAGVCVGSAAASSSSRTRTPEARFDQLRTGRLCFLSSGSRNEQINKHKDDVEKALGSWAAGIEVVL
jgi:hypothetical protein